MDSGPRVALCPELWSTDTKMCEGCGLRGRRPPQKWLPMTSHPRYCGAERGLTAPQRTDFAKTGVGGHCWTCQDAGAQHLCEPALDP